MTRRRFLTWLGHSALVAYPVYHPDLPSFAMNYPHVHLRLDDQHEIYAFSAGTVRVRPPHYHWQGPPALRFPAILGSHRWTEALPVWVFFLKTAQGNFLIDTGEFAGVNDPAYLSGDMAGRVSRRILHLSVAEEEQADFFLRQMGQPPETVDAVLLTHLHLDHTDGLRFFTGAEIWVNKKEWNQPFGAVTSTFPPNLRLKQITFDDRVAPFGPARKVTEYLWLVPTPGHTPGHQSVAFFHGDTCFFFAGDASFSQHQLLHNHRGGIVADWNTALKTYGQIREWARTGKFIYLPSHDPLSGTRLANREALT